MFSCLNADSSLFDSKDLYHKSLDLFSPSLQVNGFSKLTHNFNQKKDSKTFDNNSSQQYFCPHFSHEITTDSNQKKTDGVLKNLDSVEIEMLKQKALNNEVKIFALETISELAKRCAQSGIKAEFDFWPFDSSKNESKSFLKPNKRRKSNNFEVEKIVDYVIKKNQVFFAIKWKNWDASFNTWEPIENLSGCLQIIQEFSLKELIYLSREDAFKSIVKLILTLDKITSKSYSDPAIILKLTQVSLSDYKYTPSHLTSLKKQLKEKYSPFVKCLEENENKQRLNYFLIFNHMMKELNIRKHFDNLENFLDFIDNRKKLQPKLKKWEDDYNQQIRRETLSAEIKIENLVDLEGPPENFVFISSCKIDSSIVYFDEDPPIWCGCGENCYDNKSNCCPSNMEGKFVYTRNGTIRADPQSPIFECNKKCKCPISCPNRCIQRGRQQKVCIFRTDNGCGWGVKALEKIPKGAFVMEYVGEIITVEEADRRGKEYDAEGRTYLFDLDFNVDADCLYVIDAAHYGDISHFVNHSCEPNLEVYVAWINNYNMRLSRIAFFSKRVIKAGEQLTFDYKMTSPFRHSENQTSNKNFNLNLTHKNDSLILEKGPKVIVEQIQDSCSQPVFVNDNLPNDESSDISSSNLPKNILLENVSNFNTDLTSEDAPVNSSLHSSSSLINKFSFFSLPQKEEINSEPSFGTDTNEQTSKRILCKCGASNCRYFLF